MITDLATGHLDGLLDWLKNCLVVLQFDQVKNLISHLASFRSLCACKYYWSNIDMLAYWAYDRSGCLCRIDPSAHLLRFFQTVLLQHLNLSLKLTLETRDLIFLKIFMAKVFTDFTNLWKPQIFCCLLQSTQTEIHMNYLRSQSSQSLIGLKEKNQKFFHK